MPTGVVNLDQGGFGRWHTRVLPPPPDLADIVESSFVLRDELAPHGSSRIVPDPSAHLIVVRTREGTARASVVGARSTFVDIDVSRRQLTLGVRLRPGVLADMMRERASSFTDRAFPLEDVMGRSGNALERAHDAEPEVVLDALLGLVRSKARAGRGNRTFIAMAQSSSVAAAAHALGMPLRTLHARALEVIGLSPKRVLRILRLYRALQTVRPSLGWAGVAAHAGFSDQPHLVREIQALLGETPRQWLARGAHHPLRAADSFKTQLGTRAQLAKP
ncbi:helix-turn-helix domain-containing protein [Pendulispora rubella]|uniref:Helix-turn-helix domain-containing protein n=1 Tax=Pendulispora rubella TaxID=2741070 RepID=A0ABZ2L6B2_9BACT